MCRVKFETFLFNHFFKKYGMFNENFKNFENSYL